MNYYDLILGAIPGSILAVTGGLSLVGIGIGTAVPIGAVVATALIVHALFARSPSRRRGSESSQQPTSFQSAD